MELPPLGSLFCTRTWEDAEWWASSPHVAAPFTVKSCGPNCENAPKHFVQNYLHPAAGTLLQYEPKNNGVPNVFMSDIFFSSDLICANFDSSLEKHLRSEPEDSQFWILTTIPQMTFPIMRGNRHPSGVIHLEDVLWSCHCLHGSLDFW